MRQVTPRELADWLADGQRVRPTLLDVREPVEFDFCRIEGSVPMPMGSVSARLAELDPDADIVVICHHGARSAQVCMFLERQGFVRVANLAGGVEGWAVQVDPAMPRY